MVPRRGRLFNTARQGKENQPILYVRDRRGGAERVLLDPNKLAADGTVALDWWYPSRDGKLVAYEGHVKRGTKRSEIQVGPQGEKLKRPE